MTDRSRLAPLVRALGRGPGRARHLTRDEAAEALALTLDGTAAPEAVGALLMLLRYRGENAEEVAGFVDALSSRTAAWADAGAAVDWPSYAAGRSRGAPWFLLAAKLVAMAGAPVLLHGANLAANPAADVRSALPRLGIPVVDTPADAEAALCAGGVAYAPLEAVDGDAFRVLGLRDVLGLRSPINTALRAMNPAAAPTSLQGVFHPTYRGLQQETGRLLGQPRQLVLKGGGGEFERHPGKTVELLGLRDGALFEVDAPPLLDAQVRLADAPTADIAALWDGAAEDPFSQAVVIGTAAAALLGAGLAADLAEAEAAAAGLWRDRRRKRAA